ncbi:MAG: hypothetical protein GC151_11035 [Betaproteobacteria bacterium]|nr:hypothetical protein [Betaproteobacteria bacterium]
MADSKFGSWLPVLLLVVAIVGGTANLGYWAYCKRTADGLDTPLFRVKMTIRDAAAICKQKRDETTDRGLVDLRNLDIPDSVEMDAPKACDAASRAALERESLLQEQRDYRADAWRAVRVLVAWPLLGAIGLVMLRSRLT